MCLISILEMGDCGELNFFLLMLVFQCVLRKLLYLIFVRLISMGRKYGYFPLPPPKFEEKYWGDVGNRKLHHIIKLEPIKKNSLLIYCIDGVGRDVVIFGCPFRFERDIQKLLEIGVDARDREIYFITKGTQGYQIIRDGANI